MIDTAMPHTGRNSRGLDEEAAKAIVFLRSDTEIAVPPAACMLTRCSLVDIMDYFFSNVRLSRRLGKSGALSILFGGGLVDLASMILETFLLVTCPPTVIERYFPS